MCDSSVNESLFTISVEDQDARAAAAEHSRWIVQEGNGEGAVDGRFVLKITDFGLQSLREISDCEEEDYAYWKSEY